MIRNEAQAMRKTPVFEGSQVDALGAYVQSMGGGPTVPRDANGQVADGSLLGSDIARGGDLYRLNCASCHNFTGRGGALSRASSHRVSIRPRRRRFTPPC